MREAMAHESCFFFLGRVTNNHLNIRWMKPTARWGWATIGGFCYFLYRIEDATSRPFFQLVQRETESSIVKWSDFYVTTCLSFSFPGTRRHLLISYLSSPTFFQHLLERQTIPHLKNRDGIRWNEIKNTRRMLIGSLLFEFYGISTIVSPLMPNLIFIQIISSISNISV